MLKILFCFVFSAPICFVFNQEFEYTFGKVTPEEIKYELCSYDTESEAVAFFDIGRSTFVKQENRYILHFERTTRIKVLSDAGTKWAEIEIPIYQEGNIYEKVINIEAFTYNMENGNLQKVTFDNKNIFEEKINNFWKVKKFALPNVKAGSIIEYRYTIESQYLFNLRDWEFQKKIPVLYSEYEVHMIPFYEYVYILQGRSKFDYQHSFVSQGLPRYFGSIEFQDMIHRYVMKEVPSFKSEEFITSINDYLIKIDFQLSRILEYNGAKIDIITTWDKMYIDLIKEPQFGKYISKASRSSNKIINLDEVMQKSEEDRVKDIIETIKLNFNWDGYYRKYTIKSISQFLSEKTGSCSEMNLFLTGVLRSADIEAYPVLISTRGHGKLKYDYPFLHFFNYVVVLVKVGNKFFLTDATRPNLAYDRLPTECLNDQGFVIKKGEPRWVNLQNNTPSKTITTIKQAIKEDYSISCEMKIKATEYDVFKLRNIYNDNDRITEIFSKRNYHIIDSTLNITDKLLPGEPFLLSCNFNTEVDRINNKIYVTPFLAEPITDNPLKQNERSYSVDFIYATERIYVSEIIVPSGYKTDFIPENILINNELFTLIYNVSTLNEKVLVNCSYSFKKAVYEPEDYNKLKQHFEHIIKICGEKIVLVKN